MIIMMEGCTGDVQLPPAVLHNASTDTNNADYLFAHVAYSRAREDLSLVLYPAAAGQTIIFSAVIALESMAMDFPTFTFHLHWSLEF